MPPFSGFIISTTLPASASIVIGIQETLRTFERSACLGEEISIECPDSTVIDVLFARYGAVASGSSEEDKCLTNKYPHEQTIEHQYTLGTTTIDETFTSPSPSSNSIGTSSTTSRPKVHTLNNDYLDDQEVDAVNQYHFVDESSSISSLSYNSNNNKHVKRPYRSSTVQPMKSRKRRTHFDDDQRLATIFDDDFNCQGDVDVRDVSIAIHLIHQVHVETYFLFSNNFFFRERCFYQITI